MDPRAIAVQGIGFSPTAVAVQGFTILSKGRLRPIGLFMFGVMGRRV